MSTPWPPHVTVATVVEDNGRFLLVEERADGNNTLVFNQPAGHLEPNESLVEAAIRETFEETGWHVTIEGVVGVGLYLAPSNQTTYYRTTFFASAIEHDPTAQLDDGIQRAVWLTLNEMRAATERMRSPMVVRSVEQYVDGHRYPLSLIYQ